MSKVGFSFDTPNVIELTPFVGNSSGHFLPVFRLPGVEGAATFINRIPTEPTAAEVQARYVGPTY